MTKLFCWLWLVFFVVLTPVFAGAGEEETVLRMEREWCAAYQRSDASAIAEALTDDYTLTDSHGQITTKADDLTDARTGNVHYDVFENSEMKVRIYGDATAIVTGKTTCKGTAAGQPMDVLVQFTDTLVKIDGKWRLAAGHVSRLTH